MGCLARERKRLAVQPVRLKVEGGIALRKLGIIANYMPNYSLKPWIDTIAEGLVREWNKAQEGAAIEFWSWQLQRGGSGS